MTRLKHLTALDRWTATQRLVSLLHTAQLQKE